MNEPKIADDAHAERQYELTMARINLRREFLADTFAWLALQVCLCVVFGMLIAAVSTNRNRTQQRIIECVEAAQDITDCVCAFNPSGCRRAEQ